MSVFAKTRVADPEIAEDGIWIFGAYQGLLDVKVRRTKSRAASRVLRQLRETLPRNASQAQKERMDKLWVARGVLLDWRPAEGSDMKVPAYSEEAALEAFNDDPDFLDEVVEYAEKAENFRRERLKEDAGNSEAPSAGNSKKATTGAGSKSS